VCHLTPEVSHALARHTVHENLLQLTRYEDGELDARAGHDGLPAQSWHPYGCRADALLCLARERAATDEDAPIFSFISLSKAFYDDE
jgi:hypothetical protein